MYVRHKRSADGLAKECDPGHESRQVGAEPGAQGESAHQEREDGEEEGDDVEHPGEAAHVPPKVLMIGEGCRYAAGGAEIPHRIKALRCVSVATVCGVAVGHAAHGQIRPSRWVVQLTVAARDACGRRLEEVGLVQRSVVVVHARQHDEEGHRDPAGKQDDRDQGEEWAPGGHDGNRSARRLRWIRRRVLAAVSPISRSVQWPSLDAQPNS